MSVQTHRLATGVYETTAELRGSPLVIERTVAHSHAGDSWVLWLVYDARRNLLATHFNKHDALEAAERLAEAARDARSYVEILSNAERATRKHNGNAHNGETE